MGIFGRHSRHVCDDVCVRNAQQRPDPETRNPDPYNFKIVDIAQVKRHVVVMVRYPNCTNYEGQKCLLYRNMTIARLVNERCLDPHFTNKPGVLAPFARYVPTREGWDAAVATAESLV